MTMFEITEPFQVFNRTIYFQLILQAMLLFLEMEVSYFESIYQRNNFSIVHHLLFNVSALPIEEQLQEAELKLWAIVNFSPENLFG